MTQKEILEGNKLIAGFLGGKIRKPDEQFESEWIQFHAFCSYSIKELRYYHDWKWLMPVVVKIESIYDEHHGFFGVYISSNTCSIQGTNLHKAIDNLDDYGYVYMSDPNAIFPTKIESTWYNVVKFIEWYNENLKK